MQDGGVVALPLVEPPKSPAPVRLPFFEKFKNKIDTTPPALVKEEDKSPLSATSDSSYGGLAYADSDEEDEETEPPAIQMRKATGELRKEEPVLPIETASKVHFPSMRTNSVSAKSESDYSNTSPPPSPRLPMRSLSAASSAASAYALRSAAKSTGALDRSMETLFEEDAMSPTVTSASSPAMFPLGDGPRDSMSKPPKLPTRAHTSPTMGSGRPDSRHANVTGKRRERTSKRVCIKCDSHIDDGRWIQMDGGSVLCDKCWKNMYLPKVSH